MEITLNLGSRSTVHLYRKTIAIRQVKSRDKCIRKDIGFLGTGVSDTSLKVQDSQMSKGGTLGPLREKSTSCKESGRGATGISQETGEGKNHVSQEF